MLKLLFTVLMIMVFGRIFIFALQATWGISKIIVSVVLLPLVLVGLVLKGLIYLALPILIIVGICALFFAHD